MNRVERKNSDLHLQMSLLAEHEITRIARVAGLIADHFGIKTHASADLEEVQKDIVPEEILNRIEAHEKKLPTHLTST